MNGTEDNEIGILISQLLTFALLMILLTKITNSYSIGQSLAKTIQSLMPCPIEKIKQ